MLRRRLRVRMRPENTFIPEGSVFIGNGSGKSMIDEHFARGKESLHVEAYERAAACFEASAHKASGIQQDIANNYRAYSLARLGEPLRARLILSPLCKRQFAFPSAYWNLACCMSAEQKAEQLAVLAGGIYKAPHPFLLYGAVHLATFLGHKLLPQWLLCLPLTEAVLLYYYFQHDLMSSAEKEHGILRLGAYVFGGEPEALNPLEPGIPQYKLKAFINALFERQKHMEVVDFWLRCRRRIGQKRYDFWQMRADYLYQFGRKKRSVNAFRSELQCRLNLLASTPHLQSNLQFLSATRMRVGIYLRRCIFPDMHNQGRAIFSVLARFEERHEIKLLPRNSQIRALFSEDEATPPAEAGIDRLLQKHKQNVSPIQLH